MKGIQPQVESDGRTVWVNAPECIARFCPISGEVFQQHGDFADRQETLYMKRASDPKIDWKDWVGMVKKHHGVTVGEEYRPRFVGKP